MCHKRQLYNTYGAIAAKLTLITDLPIEVIFTNYLFSVSTIRYLHHLDRKSIVRDILCVVVKKYSFVAVTVSLEFFDYFDIFFAKQIPLKSGRNLNQI